MAAHSSIIAWKIPWTEEPGRLQSMGCNKSDTHTAAKPPPSTLVKQLFPVQNASLRCLTGVLKSFLVIKCL